MEKTKSFLTVISIMLFFLIISCSKNEEKKTSLPSENNKITPKQTTSSANTSKANSSKQVHNSNSNKESKHVSGVILTPPRVSGSTSLAHVSGG